MAGRRRRLPLPLPLPLLTPAEATTSSKEAAAVLRGSLPCRPAAPPQPPQPPQRRRLHPHLLRSPRSPRLFRPFARSAGSLGGGRAGGRAAAAAEAAEAAAAAATEAATAGAPSSRRPRRRPEQEERQRRRFLCSPMTTPERRRSTPRLLQVCLLPVFLLLHRRLRSLPSLSPEGTRRPLPLLPLQRPVLARRLLLLLLLLLLRTTEAPQRHETFLFCRDERNEKKILQLLDFVFLCLSLSFFFLFVPHFVSFVSFFFLQKPRKKF